MSTVFKALRLAFQHHRANRLAQAGQVYREVLKKQPNNPDALYGLGILAQQVGQYLIAEKFFKLLLCIQPSSAKAFFGLGNSRLSRCQWSEAVDAYLQAIAFQPESAAALNNLGYTLQQQGKADEALAYYQRALELYPHHTKVVDAFQGAVAAEEEQAPPRLFLEEANVVAQDSLQSIYHLITNNLGNVLKEQGKLEEAVESYQQALRLNPNFAQAHNNLGNALQEQGKLEEAIESYQQALRLNPDFAQAHNNLGNVLQEQGKLEEAVKSYQQALRLNSDFAQAHNNLGNALQEQGKLEEAVESYQQVLRLNPNFAQAHNNLASVLKKQGKLEEAVESYQQVLRLNPNFAQAHNNLAGALKEQGKREEAVESYQQVLRLNPKDAQAKFGVCMSQLPILYSNFDEIKVRRNSYKQYLQELAQSFKVANKDELEKAAEAVGSSLPFFLAYQGLNDRHLQQTYGEMICQIMSSRYPQWSQSAPLASVEHKQKVRIGFISAFFRLHSVWKIPLKGWIENLDREKFELFGYYTGSKRDTVTTVADETFTKFVQGPLSMEKWCEIISQDKLHILLFPEIGMDPMTIGLGCLKLAPIQVAFGGHPETTGLPTIDYHLSSDLMEPENAQDHYTEKLVRLPNLAICYTPLKNQPINLSKNDIGLNDDDIMFWCCQSLFKYLPQHDDVFPRIAKGLEKGKFLFISNQSKLITEVFQQRLRSAFRLVKLDYTNHCKFLPRLDVNTFAGITAIADVFLDSIGWSGNNTTMESTAYNIPIVTLPGELMRGRHAMAILKTMGIEETIAFSKEDYVRIAIRLGRDPQYRQCLSTKIAKNKHKLYGDLEPIRFLEKFLFNAVH